MGLFRTVGRVSREAIPGDRLPDASAHRRFADRQGDGASRWLSPRAGADGQAVSWPDPDHLFGRSDGGGLEGLAARLEGSGEGGVLTQLLGRGDAGGLEDRGDRPQISQLVGRGDARGLEDHGGRRLD